MTKPKKIEARNEVVLKTCHDIRKIRVCAICDGLGLEEGMAGFDAGTHVHLACYYETFGEAKLLRLPEVDLRKVKVGDVSVQTMRKLLKKVSVFDGLNRRMNGGAK